MEMKSPTLTDANAALRNAVETRLAGGCCDGQRCTPKGPEPHPSSRRFMELLDEMAKLHRTKSADYGSE